jgi:hypothetical protein
MEEIAMGVTTIDPSDDALAKAPQVSGEATKREAEVANTALREHVERAARRARHVEIAQEWDYDGWQQRHRAEKRGEE